MSNLLYAVFKTGVYRQECGGIFSSLDKARMAAEQLRDGEKDGYHNYAVVPFELDEKTPQKPLVERDGYGGRKYLSGGELVEADVVVDVGCKSI